MSISCHRCCRSIITKFKSGLLDGPIDSYQVEAIYGKLAVCVLTSRLTTCVSSSIRLLKRQLTYCESQVTWIRIYGLHIHSFQCSFTDELSLLCNHGVYHTDCNTTFDITVVNISNQSRLHKHFSNLLLLKTSAKGSHVTGCAVLIGASVRLGCLQRG